MLADAIRTPKAPPAQLKKTQQVPSACCPKARQFIRDKGLSPALWTISGPAREVARRLADGVLSTGARLKITIWNWRFSLQCNGVMPVLSIMWHREV